MNKMLKVTIKMANGSEQEMRTYANDETTTPEQAFAVWLHDGAKILKYEWIDTLTPRQKKWNEDHPDDPVKFNV